MVGWNYHMEFPTWEITHYRTPFKEACPLPNYACSNYEKCSLSEYLVGTVFVFYYSPVTWNSQWCKSLSTPMEYCKTSTAQSEPRPLLRRKCKLCCTFVHQTNPHPAVETSHYWTYQITGMAMTVEQATIITLQWIQAYRYRYSSIHFKHYEVTSWLCNTITIHFSVVALSESETDFYSGQEGCVVLCLSVSLRRHRHVEVVWKHARGHLPAGLMRYSWPGSAGYTLCLCHYPDYKQLITCQNI